MSLLLRKLMTGHGYMAPAGDDGSDTGGGGTDTGTVEEVVEESGETADSAALEMSDEDFLKQPMPTGTAAKVEQTDEEKAAAAAAATAVKPGDEDLDPDNPDAGDDKEAKAAKAARTVATDKPAGTAGEAGKGAEAGAAGADGKDKSDKSKPEVSTEKAALSDADVKAFYDKITAPFKANGREIKVDNAEDAIQLMQMGANYNKRMAALKPHLKMVRMLENNGLLNEEQLSFLIDVSKKDPKAISKLVKESGIDPMDLSSDKASEYKPGFHAVSDTEVELDTVLEEVKATFPQAYNQTLEVVSRKWDATSKQAIAASPQVLKIVAAHIDAGIYDLITKEVENERLFGRLSGLSDIEAYRKVGDDMNAKGRFNHLGSGSSQTGDRTTPSTKVVVEPPKKPADKDRDDRRRAASPAKPVPSSSTSIAADYNPLSLSDEEFAKQVRPKFL